jgi:hypothetical protein
VNDPTPHEQRPAGASAADADPVIEAYKKDVDRTLIRENLKLSVEQRLKKLAALQRLAIELRRAGQALREKK